MNSVMEDVSSTFALDPQEEMRLLKDKVRQLELQNKQLRRSQQHLRSLSPCKTVENNSKDLKQSFNMSMSDEGNEKSSKESSLEDLGIIDVEFMSELDDETWLYEPPETGAGEATAAPLTSTTRERVAVQPREAVAVNSALPSLSDQLDEITQLASTAEKLRQMLSCVKSNSGPSRTFDSRTFTRPRRRRPALDLEAMPTIAAVEAGSPRELPVRPAVQPVASPEVVSPSQEEASPNSSVPPVVPSQTLPRAPVSVHEIARLQEESLRLSSPISSPKRTSTTSGRVAESSPDDSLDDQHEVHQSRVQNAEGDARQRLRTPPLSLARTMENQSPSPGSSPYGSNSSLHQMSQIPSKDHRPLRIAHVGTHPLVLRGGRRLNTTIGAFLSLQDVPCRKALSGLATESVSRIAPFSYAATCKVHACSPSGSISSTYSSDNSCGHFRSTEVGAAATFSDSTATFAEEVSAVQELLPLCLRM
ncbi:hypothetical protein HPB51_007711 [Rhipicephalus microplus]|uniref:Uncharacterized protein n=1 Tax=Rhipicephalus microplus TaxID=6941 RepID=A0A9J6DT25_RHIMP|nr:hypothetical protein HPB51_007711 [Rhipicephalus microplus]